MTEDELLKRARRRVNLKMGFYTHLLVYVLVNGGLALMGLLRGGWTWQAAPLLGWGLGLSIHGVVTLIALKGDGMRERMTDEEVKRLRDRG